MQAAELERRHAGLAIGAETDDRVRVAGRIRAMRNNGMFIDLHDASGKIQIFCHRDLSVRRRWRLCGCSISATCWVSRVLSDGRRAAS